MTRNVSFSLGLVAIVTHRRAPGRSARRSTDEPAGLGQELAEDAIDLRVDRLGGDLVEHDRRQDLLEDQAPDAADDHDEQDAP